MAIILKNEHGPQFAVADSAQSALNDFAWDTKLPSVIGETIIDHTSVMIWSADQSHWHPLAAWHKTPEHKQRFEAMMARLEDM